MGIRIENLVKSFNGFKAVDGISFEVNKGEFVTLLGPSGSGKSTVLRCIAGLETPASGRIEVKGEDVTKVPVQERKVGFVFQHFALFRHMNVLDNISFGLKVRGIKKEQRHEKAGNLLGLVGLEGLERRMPSQLSGGQRQRVALARALAPEPELLLLDEPFGALDTRLRKELRGWLKELHHRIQLTTLLVTHDQDEAFEVSDRILVMNHGRIEQDAKPQNVFNEPATEFVAAFVGETNRIEGVVKNCEVAWGHFRFKAVHLPGGTKAVVLFRPNDVYVTTYKERGGWPGRITGIRFLGATEVLEIAMDDGGKLTAHIPKGVAGLSGFVNGKQVFVLIAGAHVYAVGLNKPVDH